MATTATQVNGHRPPDLTEAERHGLRAFWQIYDQHYEEITAESMRLLAGDPEFGPLMQSIPADVQEEQNRHSRELMARAMRDGEWTAYFADLHAQGATYARSGLSFASWFRAIAVIRPVLVRLLRQAFDDQPDGVFPVVEAMDKWLDHALSVIGDAYLTAKEETIREQQDAIRELSTPVLTIMDGLLLLPVVGVIDSHRARQMTDQLLQAIHRNRAKVVVIDITGVAAVDSMVANHLIQSVEAAGLLGAAAIVTGLSADVAQTVVKIGVDLSRLRTVGDLQGGVTEGMKHLGYRLVRPDAGAD